MFFLEQKNPKSYIKESIEVENIPLCAECIIEDELGYYICSDCRINLCSNHVKEHTSKFKNHKYSYLYISDLIINHQVLYLIQFYISN